MVCVLACRSGIISAQTNQLNIYILGIAQDGGYPHIGCSKECCTRAWQNSSLKKFVVSLALVDSNNKKWWLFEATPDIKDQLHLFQLLTHSRYNYLPDGIFITHAHIGHYTGLMEFGKEAMNTDSLPVYVLPRLKTFLENNGPWSQLVRLNNIHLVPIQADSAVYLSQGYTVTPIIVPHRDEFSETAGFEINTPGKKYLFIPDINKWQQWNRDIVRMVQQFNVALLDATFYDSTELPGKRMADVPHPFALETTTLFNKQDVATRNKIYFIHMNHTNPLIWREKEKEKIKKAGYHIAQQGMHL
jgi:pyrroloquinoline quinone biosynthesis protein B